jgi:WD40 repeat protein
MAHLWDAATGQRVGIAMQHGGEIWVAQFSRDGRRIATGSWDGTARLWDAETGRPVGQPLAHGHQVWAAAFSQDSRWLVTGSWDGTARLWDATTGRPLGPPLAHGARVWSVAIGAGDRLILTGSYDTRGCLWSMPSPVQGSDEQIVLWVQVLTGLELDASGGSHALDAAAWQEHRQHLEDLGGPPAL